VDHSGAAECATYVLNVSEGGLGIRLDEPVPVGIEVKVVIGDFTFTGSVVYCRRVGDSFHAGIAAWHEHFPDSLPFE
jgi:hypothetical protein